MGSTSDEPATVPDDHIPSRIRRHHRQHQRRFDALERNLLDQPTTQRAGRMVLQDQGRMGTRNRVDQGTARQSQEAIAGMRIDRNPAGQNSRRRLHNRTLVSRRSRPLARHLEQSPKAGNTRLPKAGNTRYQKRETRFRLLIYIYYYIITTTTACAHGGKNSHVAHLDAFGFNLQNPSGIRHRIRSCRAMSL